MSTKFKRRIKEIAGRIITMSPKISSIYYALFSESFHNEHFAVVSGLYKNKMDIENLGNFRRNIHRLEKGLIAVPQKQVFAEDYILETVQVLKNLIIKSIDESTINWGLGILAQYFNIVHDTATIRKARSIYQTVAPETPHNLPSPFLESERVKSRIGFNDFMELNKQRCSIRYYQNKAVPRNLVEKAIEVALQAPSACNRQPFIFRIIDEPKLLKEAVKLPIGATSFSENIKMIIFIIGDLSNYFDERDKHLIYIDSSLAAMSFVLALETIGLSSCIINWSDIPANNKRLKETLDLNHWEQCVMSISVGYADSERGIPSSVKKDSRSVIKYN